jgi:hypothetical protein
MCSVVYDDSEHESLDELGKFLQRVAAVGLIPKSHKVVNKILDRLDIEAIDESVDINEILTPSTSRSGDGMQEGLPSGTGSAVGTTGASDNNLENAS